MNSFLDSHQPEAAQFAIAKPPGAPGAPAAIGLPKPPAAPGISMPPAVGIAKSPLTPGAPAASGIKLPGAPAARPMGAPPKKETSKISLPQPAKTVPQATMNLKQAAPKAPKTASNASTVDSAEKTSSSDPYLILGIAAIILALLSLGIQIWTMTDA